MFPEKSKVPVQEFKAACHVVSDTSMLTKHFMPSVLETPLRLDFMLIKMQPSIAPQLATICLSSPP